MYHQILALEKQIPEFNQRPFDFSDFRYLCDKETIRFYFWSFPPEIKGVYINIDFPVIGLNETLKSPELEIVAFQELGHYYLGHPNSFTIERDTLLLPKIEYEAKVFSALCLVPTPILEKEKDNILVNFPLHFRKFRMEIYNAYLRKKVNTYTPTSPLSLSDSQEQDGNKPSLF